MKIITYVLYTLKFLNLKHNTEKLLYLKSLKYCRNDKRKKTTTKSITKCKVGKKKGQLDKKYKILLRNVMDKTLIF